MKETREPIAKPESRSRRGALGKGFDSLLGLDQDNRVRTPAPEGVASEITSDMIQQLPINALEPNPHQPRKLFDQEALESLSRSIKVDGILQPVVVTKSERTGRYIIVAGERRTRAAKLAGLDRIPAIIRERAPESLLRLALIENIQREDLNVMEEAEAYQSLISDFGLTQEQCALKVGKDRSTVSNTLRLLTLPREVHDDLMAGKLSMGHGRALLAIEDKKLILRARDIIVQKELSVRQTEKLCKTFTKNGQESSSESKNDGEEAMPDLDYVAESLRNHLRTKVKLSGNSQRGRVEVSYFSSTELERILLAMGVSF